MKKIEGILTSWNHKINVSAAGGHIKDKNITLCIYRPSDTARNLEENDIFSFSLTNDEELFFKASLTGRNDPEYQELSSDELIEQNSFMYPKQASITFFCKIDDRTETVEEDEYGKAMILEIESTIQKRIGMGYYIGRENPLVDAMVHASRIHLADEKQNERIKNKVKEILKNESSHIASNILKHVGVKR
ncbi:MAG: DUF447 domain-containing protein [Thermoplasmatota archaeon]